MRAYENLAPGSQDEVRNLRQTIFYRWPTPKVPADALADWDDDLAVLYVDFGFVKLDAAISHARQNSDRRPTIPQLRDHCKAARDREGKKFSQADIDMARHDAMVRRHQENPDDTNFIPFALILRDVAEFHSLKAQARAARYVPQEGEIEQWWEDRNAKTEEEWRDLRRQGVKQLVMRSGPFAEGINHRRGGDAQSVSKVLHGGEQLSLDTTTR